MSDSKPFEDLATEITIATIQGLELKLPIMDESSVKSITDVIQEIYKAAMKALKENQ